jgi:hypothetical protein
MGNFSYSINDKEFQSKHGPKANQAAKIELYADSENCR